MEIHSTRIHRLLISTTSRLVGEYDSASIAITHAWPDTFPKNVQPHFGLHENSHSRNYYVLSLEIEDAPKEQGRLSPIPNYRGYGDELCVALSLIFGKRFDNHGFLVSHGVYGVPDFSLIRPTTYFTAGPNSHKPRSDLEIPLNLEEFGRVASLFTNESLHPRFRHILFAAGRFYLRSLQVFDYEPEFAYLDLVTSGEILANYYKFPDEELFDEDTARTFGRISREMHRGDKVVRKFKASMRQIKRAYTLTVTRLVNDAFFTRTESTMEICGLKKADFERRIKAAYDLRSQYVHTGVDFGRWMAPHVGYMNEVQLGEPVVEDERLAESLKLAPLYYGMERVMRYCLLRFVHLHGVHIDDCLGGIAPSPKAAHEDEKNASGSKRGRSGPSLKSDENPNGVSVMNPQIVTIMCCHEAAHGVAAYRLRFPFRYVRFTVPVAGLPLDSDLGVDSKAMELAYRYLVGQDMSLVRYWGSYLAVLAIAKFVNQHYNRVSEAEAAGYARKDFEAFDQRMATFPQPLRDELSAEIDHIINDVWRQPCFAQALNAVADALLRRHYLTDQDVVDVIEAAVGTDMRSATHEPDQEHIRGSAFYDHTRRVEAGEDGTPVGDWLLSERALRYARA